MEQQIVVGVLSKLNEKRISNRRDITGLMYRKANYTKPRTYEYLSEDYQPVTRAELFTECNTVFVKGTITFPEEIRSDEDYEDCLFLRFHNLGGVVFIDGEPYNGIDENRDRIPLRKEWAGQTKELLIEGYCLQLSYDLDTVHPTCMAYAYFGRVDKKVEQFIYDIRLANEWYVYDCAHPQDDNIYIRKKITTAFEASIRHLDLSATGESFRSAVTKACGIFREKLAAIDDGEVRPHVNLVASTHIDTAWLWQLKDTIRKTGHSYSNMLRLLDTYPEFKFSHSQPKLLEYTKEYYPALFEQIKERAKEGRWENVGPMWVESDCNVVSGESLTRQILYGADFLEKEFGSRPRMAWLPDTFGFQANLPQIFKKSGTDYFYSYKLHWQAEETFPYGDFRWKGIDGSEIVCSVINNRKSGYNGMPCPEHIRDTANIFEQKGEIDEIIFPYGFGDGGGGPTREMIEYAKRLEDFPGMPNCEITTAQEFFDRLEKVRSDLPLWYGELYIQTHRGTLTTESYMKKTNRRFEMLYQSLEKLGVMAEQCGASPDWSLLEKGWKDALTLQFHDILPGSSIDPVYEDCHEIYDEVFRIADRFLESTGLEKQIHIHDGIRVLNTLSWDRDVLVTVRCRMDDLTAIAGTDLSLCKVVSADGTSVPCSVSEKDGMAELTFLAKNVKALSFADYKVTGAAAPGTPENHGSTANSAAVSVTPARSMAVSETSDGYLVENDRYKAVIDSAGRFTSLFDKCAKKQVLSAPGNNIRFFLDGPSIEDAWNIYANYKKREVDVFTDSRCELVENGDLRTVIRVHRSNEKTVLVQDIIFYQDNARIDFKTWVDWQEENKVMRVYFPTTMNAPYFTSEVGFGAYTRPTIGNTKLDKAKFEVAAHRFVDISENRYGVALLNDSKYAHDVQYDTIGITLLRSTCFPAKYPDKGIQEFTYSLLPHTDSWAQSDIARAGIELNADIHTINAIGKGNFVSGLFTCSDRNLVIDTVKPALDGSGIVVRLYESNGTSGEASLNCQHQILSAIESNLVEKKIEDAVVCENAIPFTFTPYEVKTFIVKLR